jgi:hypothetical protein
MAALICALVTACSRGVPIEIETDEPIESATLHLNGQTIPMKEADFDRHTATWEGADASGTIEIVYSDGASSSCRVGYVTNGLERQRFVVKDRQCM